MINRVIQMMIQNRMARHRWRCNHHVNYVRDVARRGDLACYGSNNKIHAINLYDRSLMARQQTPNLPLVGSIPTCRALLFAPRCGIGWLGA